MILLEINSTTLWAAAAGLVVGILVMLANVFKNPAVVKALSDLIIRGLGNHSLLSFEKLKEHDIFIKLEQYASGNAIETTVIIDSDAKKRLYDQYCKIIASVWLLALQPFLNGVSLDYSEQQLKALLVKQRTYAFNEYDKRFSELLVSINPDKDTVRDIVEKLSQWRIGEMAVIMQNGIEACSGGGVRLSNTYRIDRIFTVYSLGVDVLFKNGADSFNRLNGELDSFLDHTKI